MGSHSRWYGWSKESRSTSGRRFCYQARRTQLKRGIRLEPKRTPFFRLDGIPRRVGEPEYENIFRIQQHINDDWLTLDYAVQHIMVCVGLNSSVD